MISGKESAAMSIDYFELIIAIGPNTPILRFSIPPIFQYSSG
jgi:hypothetical protein